MQSNAEASSSKLFQAEDDAMELDEEGFDGDEIDEGAWDEEDLDYASDDSGSRDDYVEEAGSDDANEPIRQPLRAGEAGEEEQDPEEGFDRLADVLKKTMAGARGNAAALAALPELQGDMASQAYGKTFQNEIAAMDEESDEELLGDFYSRVLRPGKKQARSQKKKRRTRQSRHKPAPEVEALLGQANLAYIQSQFEEAIPILLEVVRIDNKVHSAYMTLAICHRELGNEELSLQADLVAAHLAGDAETWKDLAIRSSNLPQQALYCYKKALKLAQDDSEALYKTAMLYKDAGDERKAFAHFKKLIQTATHPHDFSILLELRPMLSKAYRSLDIGCTFYREAFEYHLIHFDGPSDQQPGKINNLDVNALIVLVDLLMMQEDYETAVDCIKRGQRWLDGRGTDQTWAHREDDLEYLPQGGDPAGGGHRLDSNLRHRLGLARLRLGDDDQALLHIEVTTQLNIVEWQQFWVESAEALMRRPQLVQRALELLGELVNNEEIDYNASVVTNFALCQQQLGNYDEAIGAFEHVVKQDPENLDVLLKLASAYEDAGQLQQALATVREVQARREVTQPSRRGRRVEDQEEPEGADPESAFIRGVIRRKKTRHAVRKTTDREKEMQEAAANTHALWEDVKYAEQGVTDGIRGAIDAFLEASGDMIEIFRMAKNNFGKDRGLKLISMKTKRKRDAEAGMIDLDEQARMMQSRLEEVPTGEEQTQPAGETDANSNEKIFVQQTHFHGISAQDWLAIIVKHCCVLTVRNDGESALDILEHVVAAGMFYVSSASLISLRLTAMAVAMHMRDVEKVVEHEHMLATTMQWRVEPKLLLLGCLGHGEEAKEAFTKGPLQKRIHRELRLYNATTNVESLRWYPGRRRWVLNDVDGDGNRKREKTSRKQVQEEDEDEDDDDEDRPGKRNQPVVVHQDIDLNGTPIRSGMDPSMNWLPTKRHPVPYIIYGLNMMSARTYQSALYYFLRAYELDPYHPYLCLLIAQCYLGRAMNRQSDNKNYQIAEGIAFLVRYRKFSSPGSECEVEFNFGRAFHSIGVTHLAVNHYEKVLKMTEEQMKMAEDPSAILADSVAREAAHNLVLIYTTSGSPRLARERAKKWLAI